MPRYKLLATIEDVVLAIAPEPAKADPAAPVGKLDVEVAFAGYTAEGVFSFDVNPHDAATHNTLNAIHVSLFERNPDGSSPAVPVDLAEAVVTGFHFSVVATGSQAGGRLDVDATDAPEGKYVALAVLEFDA